MSESYPIQKIIKIPRTQETDTRWEGYYDCLVITAKKVFFFKRVGVDYVIDNQKDYSVKVWKSKAKRVRWGLDRNNKVMMEMSRKKAWVGKKPKTPGHGNGVQEVCEVKKEDLPELKLQLLEQLI